MDGTNAEPDSTIGTTIDAVSHTASTVTVRFADGDSIRCNRFWLRDNCPDDGERASLFRSFSVCRMSDDLTIVSAAATDGSVHIEFDDGTVADFDPAWLRRSHHRPTDSDGWRGWRAGFEPRLFPIAELAPRSASHHDLLECVAHDGVALVAGLAGASDTERLAELLGPIRETDFGRVFDIVSEPDPFTPSQSTSALDPHTDDPYRYTPSGMSILHCVTPSDGSGGASVIVDGFAVAEAIREDDPAAFELLSSVAVPFVHHRPEAVDQGADVHLRAEAPIIATDRLGRVCGIRFHERSMDTLAVDADLADRFYPALMRFSRDVNGGGFAFSRRLAAGEAIIYDNQRVLHGRTGFDGAQTRRHIRLCTIDRDQVHSRLRRLRERYAPGAETAPLPAGNLS